MFTSPTPCRHSVAGAILLLGLALAGPVSAEPPRTTPPEGLRDNTPRVHALRGARIVTAPGTVIEQGTLVVREGVIEAVGADVLPPADARVWDLAGKTIYPGLIDSWWPLSGSLPENAEAERGYWNAEANAHLRAVDLYQGDSGQLSAARGQGFAVRHVVPIRGLLGGSSSLVALAGPGPGSILVDDVAQHARLTPQSRGRDHYPTSPMGAVALVRQSLYDARWYRQAWQAYEHRAGVPRPARSGALEALARVVGGELPLVVEAPDEFYLLRADRLSREFGVAALVRGSGQEYRRLEAVAATGCAVIVPLRFPKVPDVRQPEAALSVPLEKLMHWDLAPENPGRLVRAGVRIALTADGLEKLDAFWPAVRRAVSRGLDPAAALAALTTAPAELFGVSQKLGTLAPGMAAHLVVSEGDLFTEEKAKVLETWVDGDRYAVVQAPVVDPRGGWDLTFTRPDGSQATARLNLTGEAAQPSGKLKLGEREKSLTHLVLEQGLLSLVVPADLLGPAGVARVSGRITADPAGSLQFDGQIAWPDGSSTTIQGRRTGDADQPAKEDKSPQKDAPPADQGPTETDEKAEPTPTASATPESASEPPANPEPQASAESPPSPEQAAAPTANPVGEPEQPESKATDSGRAAVVRPVAEDPAETLPAEEESPSAADAQSNETPAEPAPQTVPLIPLTPSAPATSDPEKTAGEAEKAVPPKKALYEVNFPLGAWGRNGPPEQPALVAFRGGTVWTSGSAGVLEGGTVLVERGRIVAVGTDVEIPAEATVVDCTGHHLAPGIIDCHSHIATDGGVNEAGQAVTAEVRIGDFIDADDMNLYRQLAGGVTAANILHGSANPIGGQNQVIKFRWGALPEELKFEGAPPGIKFALGENVKQSNWGDRYTTRYPQTRMGVEQIMRDAFRAAQDYRRDHQAWSRKPLGLPPRIDLELEAIGEILAGRRLIHCHSYRQDEILTLLRVCEEFQVRIATLQHILEGYKVADEIARHGAGGSSFSDWWAYKVEVIDAIPFNGSLMHRVGVLMSFNSDDAELARRLNLEAAKAVKYGGLAPAEALAFVTINPARQLAIADRVGSLEVGKDADLVIWTGSPLSGYSRVRETWIDGRKYFDQREDLARRGEIQTMREALIQRALASTDPVEGAEDQTTSERARWPREDLYCGHHDHDDTAHDHGAHAAEGAHQ